MFKTCLLCIYNINIISQKYIKPLSAKIIKNFQIPAESELNNIQFYFFSVKELVNGTEVIGVKYPKQYLPIITWFTHGVFLFFLFLGNY